MSTHPNVMLYVSFTVDGTARKTLRNILTEFNQELESDEAGGNNVIIGGREYSAIVMEDDYCESYQISDNEGNLVFMDMVTYGYGESIEWEELSKAASELEQWAIGVCERHKCSHKIKVGANYW